MGTFTLLRWSDVRTLFRLQRALLFLRRKTNPFAEKLKRKRCELGLTQSDLAIKLGYHRDTIAKWETGSSISKYALEDICTFFGIEISREEIKVNEQKN